MVIIRPPFFEFWCTKIVDLKFKGIQIGGVDGKQIYLGLVFFFCVEGGGCRNFFFVEKEGHMQELTVAKILSYQVRLMANKA